MVVLFAVPFVPNFVPFVSAQKMCRALSISARRVGRVACCLLFVNCQLLSLFGFLPRSLPEHDHLGSFEILFVGVSAGSIVAVIGTRNKSVILCRRTRVQ